MPDEDKPSDLRDAIERHYDEIKRRKGKPQARATGAAELEDIPPA
jgi:hypothetical protein